MSKIKKGGLFSDKGYISATYDKAAANWQGYGHNVELEIKTKSGVMIEDLSKYKREKEVLLQRNSQFKITSVETIKENQMGKQFYYTKIKLEQIYE